MGQTNITIGGRYIMPASRSLFPFLASLYLARAAKVDDSSSLYHVVEDLASNKTQLGPQESGAVATCSDILTRNGLNFSTFWHGAAHGLHSLHLEEIRQVLIIHDHAFCYCDNNYDNRKDVFDFFNH